MSDVEKQHAKLVIEVCAMLRRLSPMHDYLTLEQRLGGG
jgi:hypothetical protein